MARNDYFVVAYKLLGYLYDCFKAGEEPDMDFISPDALKINRGYFVNMLESLQEEGYIKGVTVRYMSGGRKDIKLIHLRITQMGITFLQENSMISKAKDFLRDMHDITAIL